MNETFFFFTPTSNETIFFIRQKEEHTSLTEMFFHVRERINIFQKEKFLILKSFIQTMKKWKTKMQAAWLFKFHSFMIK